MDRQDNNTRIQILTDLYNQKLGEVRLLKSQRNKVVTELEDCEDELNINIKSRSVLDALSKLTEKNVKEYIEPLITEALRTVFGYDITFGLVFDFERNQVVVRFSLTDGHGNKVEGDIEEMKGGGILDVISIVLRFVLLELFNLEGAVVLDEPGKFVDTAHQPALGSLILSFSEKFQRQILIVTHDEAICAIGTKHYVVAQDSNGISRVTLVED